MTKFLLGIVLGLLLGAAVAEVRDVYHRLDRLEQFAQAVSQMISGGR